MPILLKPDQVFPISLSCDESEPVDTRPVFLVKAMSVWDASTFFDAYDEIVKKEHKSSAEMCSEVCGQIMQRVCGWKNMGPHEYGSSDIRSFLTTEELWELYRKILHSRYVQPEEKKS